MEKALKAFYSNQPLIDWPYVVGVENGDATLYIGGKLSGVTDNNKKYMLITLANQLKVEIKPYNETWCEIIPTRTLIDNLTFCTDCTVAAVNDDYTGLDYHYNEQEAEQRQAEIVAGLTRLSLLGSVCHAGLEGDEFSARPCDCCGSRLAGSREYFLIIK